MVFSSSIFLFIFLPITIVVYHIIPNRFKNLWLFTASFVFYAWGGLIYALLILFSTFVNYVIGIIMDEKEGKSRYIMLWTGVIFNLFILGFFKYFNFIVDNIEAIIKLISGNNNFSINAVNIPLPIGISFFTFQIMSYVIDLYRKDIKVQKNIINLGLYIMLFPQLIAGPIVRYIDVEKEINGRVITRSDFVSGFRRFVYGLSKKMIFANTAGFIADTAFNNPEMLNTPMAWLGIIGYTLQIYYDFSAYSDMAIGLGLMFGFHFLENFNYPYIASTIQDFWRRWHMSLTTWFRDYLYIPMGGNRKGDLRTKINNITVYFITGIWHGAAWTFIFWGMFHGFFQIIEKSKIGKYIKNMPKILGHIYTLLVVMFGWVIFRAETLSDTFYYWKKLICFDFDNMYLFFVNINMYSIIILIISIILCMPIFRYFTVKYRECGAFGLIENLICTILFFISIMYVSGSSFNPFIYFKF